MMDDMPVRIIKVPITGDLKHTMNVLVDGDYDGEYFATLPLRILVQKKSSRKYVMLANHYCQNHPGTPQYLHQLVLRPKPGKIITFKNGDTMDCRSSNLAYGTFKEVMDARDERLGGTISKRRKHGFYNHGGLKKSADAKSGTPYIGVRKDFRPGVGKRYLVLMQGKYRGSFLDAEEAARWYDRLARKAYGEHAKLNFPEEVV